MHIIFFYSVIHKFRSETEKHSPIILFEYFVLTGTERIKRYTDFSAHAVFFPIERLDFSITFAAIIRTRTIRRVRISGKCTHLRYEARFARRCVNASGHIETFET